MLEYASMRLMSLCAIARTEPTMIASAAAHARMFVIWVVLITKSGVKTPNMNRIIAYAPTLVISPAMSALAVDGACVYASGSHAWSGKRPTLMLKPTMKNASAARTTLLV